MKDRPNTIVCPSCRALRVNRRHKSCGVCKVALIYPGEFFTVEEADNGWFWAGKKRHWVPLKEQFEEQLKEIMFGMPAR